MKISDFASVYETHSDPEIELVLSKRYGDGVNELWLSNGTDKFPAISILVKGNLASLNYFPKPRDPGYRSAGPGLGLKPGGFTTFYINTPTEEQDVLNDSIVLFSDALAAAKQFAISTALPTAIDWVEL